MKYDFDTVYDRHHTNCAKYDSGHTDDPDMIPMWVADMDYQIFQKHSLNVCQMVFMVIVQSQKNT